MNKSIWHDLYPKQLPKQFWHQKGSYFWGENFPLLNYLFLLIPKVIITNGVWIDDMVLYENNQYHIRPY